MDEQNRRKRRSMKLWIGAVLASMIALTFLVGARRPWIEPVPGVSLDMRLPPVTEADLGPDSAYRLLLEAVKKPHDMKQLGEDSRRPAVWGEGYPFDKLLRHPWAAEPPPTLKEWVIDLELQDAARLAGKGGEDAPPALDTLLEAPEKRVLSEDGPWTREQYEYVLRTVELYEPSIPLLDRALAAPNPQMLTIQTMEQMLPYLSPARDLARHMVVIAAVKVQAGDIAEGFGLLVKTVRMGDLVTRGAGIINHLVGEDCRNRATSLVPLLVYRHDIPANVLKRTARDLIACADDAEPFVEAMRAEAYAGIRSVDLYYDKLPAKLSKGRCTYAERLTRCPPLPILMRSNPMETRRNITACYQHIVARETKATTPAGAWTYTATLREALTKKRSKAEILLRVRDPLGIAYANETLVAFNRTRTRMQVGDARTRGVALFLAVAAYAKEKGQPPADLKALVPDYLPHLPTDPFTGTSFLYQPSGVPGLPGDAWAVYSVGPDGTDDGGKGTTIGGTGKFGGPTGTDLVWPSQPYPTALGK